MVYEYFGSCEETCKIIIRTISIDAGMNGDDEDDALRLSHQLHFATSSGFSTY